MNTTVSFELAKLLKEAGFDEPCLDNYYSDGTIFSDDVKNSEIEFNEYSAPTIADVVMWIYDKYGVWIVVNITINDNWYFELYDTTSKIKAEIKVKTNFCKSPSESYEAAIKYCLTEIIKP